MKKKGMSYFLKDRNVPLDLTLIFIEFVQDSVKKELIVENKYIVRQIMEHLKYVDIHSYWLLFISNIKEEILKQEKITNKEETLL